MLGRLLAALSYFGLTGALVPLAQPDNAFVVCHARRGIALHIARIALIVPVLALPLTDPTTGWNDESLMAFAQIWGRWNFRILDVVRMLASMSEPIPTTARSNSWTESWRRASSLVESALTTWVRRPL